MLQQALTIEIPATALEQLTAPLSRIAPAELELELELSDDDLEQVAGGLARVWSEGGHP